MKAIVITEFGDADKLALKDVPEPTLSPGQVMVDVKATALNRADLLQRRGFYPPPKGESDILGLECAGVVSALGDGASSLSVGDRVMALLPGGGYAEKVAIDQRMAIPVPDALSFTDAAAIPEAFLTAREGLFTLGRLEPGAAALVHAAGGGVGSAAVQLAHDHGATVIATAGTAQKLELAKSLGADVVVNYKNEDFVEIALDTTKKKGVDVVVDFIGGGYWEKHSKCLATAGRCVVIGVMGGTSGEVNFGQILRKRLQILGLIMRARPLEDKIAITATFIRESLPKVANKTLRPVIDTVMPLADAAKAHERMEANLNLGKIVLSVADE